MTTIANLGLSSWASLMICMPSTGSMRISVSSRSKCSVDRISSTAFAAVADGNYVVPLAHEQHFDRLKDR